jgi:hypothetical protein
MKSPTGGVSGVSEVWYIFGTKAEEAVVTIM